MTPEANETFEMKPFLSQFCHPTPPLSQEKSPQIHFLQLLKFNCVNYFAESAQKITTKQF
jgi:hypothetical protein